jgi:hypothetical protein
MGSIYNALAVCKILIGVILGLAKFGNYFHHLAKQVCISRAFWG